MRPLQASKYRRDNLHEQSDMDVSRRLAEMAQRLSTVANVGRLAAGRDVVIAAAPNRRSRSRYSLLIATTLHDSRFVGRMHDGWGAQ